MTRSVLPKLLEIPSSPSGASGPAASHHCLVIVVIVASARPPLRPESPRELTRSRQLGCFDTRRKRFGCRFKKRAARTAAPGKEWRNVESESTLAATCGILRVVERASVSSRRACIRACERLAASVSALARRRSDKIAALRKIRWLPPTARGIDAIS